MGTVLASAVISRISTALNDTGNVHWSQAELLGWLNDGQRALVSVRPSANTVPVTLNLVQGTLQTLPDAYAGIVDIPCNATGEVVRSVDRSVLDTESPAWHQATANAVVREYAYDLRAPNLFWVNPPQPAIPGSVKALVGAVPAEIATVNDPLTVHDRYVPALIEYGLYRALSKDDETADLPKAERHHGKYLQLALQEISI